MQTENEQVEQIVPENITPDGTAPEKKKKSVGKEILSWILTLGAAVVIALVIRTFLFEPVRVDGESMMDTLLNNEIMFVTKPEYLFGDPQRGDVVICHYPDLTKTPTVTTTADGETQTVYPNRKDYFVKRVMGIPGDTVEVRSNVVYINGEPVDEPYLTDARNDNGFSMEPFVLGDDEYFVMGDNRDNSHDSRNYDPDHSPRALRRDQIVGHVRCVLFPFDRIRGIQ